MPKMNGTGPEGKGPKTGRGPGISKKDLSREEFPQKSGKGKGKAKRRQSGRGEGRGRRSKYGN